MRLWLPISILLVTVMAGMGVVAVWASVADAPWEGNEGSAKDNEGTASVLCEDALERRRATEDALQKPVLESQVPLSAFRGNDTYTALSDEVIRLESKLRDIEREIERFCE